MSMSSSPRSPTTTSSAASSHRRRSASASSARSPGSAPPGGPAMAPSESPPRADVALQRARRAYERAHLLSAIRALVISAGLVALAVGLHRTSSVTWLIAGALAVSLAVLAWRGGSWRRGAFAGVLAGLPPLIAPSIVFALNH